MIYVIEHLEEELGEWCLIEYEHISKIVGAGNLWITNLRGMNGKEKLEKFSKVFDEEAINIIGDSDEVGILDPEVEKTLRRSDCFKIKYFVFGGILGDYPPRKRTEKELSWKFEKARKFNLGREQMATDNAVYVVSQIVKGRELEDIEFVDGISIKINSILTTELPFKYVKVKGKGLISEKLVKYVKRKDGEE